MTRVLIAGIATRGLAESAVRAGYEVIAIDGFGDLDLRARATLVALARASGRFSTGAVIRGARAHRCDAACYVASLENHPRAVAALALRRPLWGNPPAVLARARHPVELARALAARGFAVPAVRLTPPPRTTPLSWLVKPRASGGGRGITAWLGQERVPRGSYWQQYISGEPGSVVFAADGRTAVPLGVSRLLVGEPAFGADGFRYCGNILARPAAAARTLAARLATAATEALGLVGVNGIDFVTADGVPYPIELNPRYTASMELVERAARVSVFQVHARACAGTLPRAAVATPPEGPEAVGKAILYARRDAVLPDTRAWLDDDSVRDVPEPGARIQRGRPICTIFAGGADPATCYRALVARAEAVYGSLGARPVSVA